MRTFKKALIAVMLVVSYACEEIEITTQDQTTTVSTIISTDAAYTDDELMQILEEELEIIEDEKAGRIVDLGTMDVSKSNPKKVYVHYMPWFQSKDYDGYWGQHWTMTNRNPDMIDESTGQRQIASYFYPLIGPYSSNDPDLHEYHFLMMKLAGIDGVIFDWYGSRDLHDYAMIKNSTEKFIGVMEDLGLDFSIMYEDRVAEQAAQQDTSLTKIEAAQQDFAYIRDQYFTSPNYLQHNDNNLLFVFGPEHITTESEWNEVFEVLPVDDRPDFLTLWATQDRVGPNATGEFLWIAPDHLAAHEYYYQTYPQNNMMTVGGTYPGFQSYYREGGWSDGINDWSIEHDNGNTFVETLEYTHLEVADVMQVITWNDFGEGTMIEPTEEFGFMYLQLLQQYTGVEFEPEDLQMALDLYNARKEFENNPEAQGLLDRTYKYVKQKNFRKVEGILAALYRFYA